MSFLVSSNEKERKMLVKNISKRSYIHSRLDEKYNLVMLTLKPNEVKDIPDEVAKSWLKSDDVVEYVNPEDARKQEEQLKKENAELKKALEEAKKDCAECYSDDKTPAQDDCDKCKEVKATKKKSSKKSSKK